MFHVIEKNSNITILSFYQLICCHFALFQKSQVTDDRNIKYLTLVTPWPWCISSKSVLITQFISDQSLSESTEFSSVCLKRYRKLVHTRNQWFFFLFHSRNISWTDNLHCGGDHCYGLMALCLVIYISCVTSITSCIINDEMFNKKASYFFNNSLARIGRATINMIPPYPSIIGASSTPSITCVSLRQTFTS